MNKKTLTQVFNKFKIFKSKEQRALEKEQEVAKYYSDLQKRADIDKEEIKLEMMRKLVEKVRETNLEGNINGEND